ncbi:hypothetical protein L596_011443 [Steinernema carpocapsae]|uniref:Uncharacterized protein n=1 Tax=Steinernema carpocapsae TaxID=34508 RepID=A0A4U5NUU8_STECR|nr:hypothetical protein L596_011443 [Steinernema carpocapsae]
MKLKVLLAICLLMLIVSDSDAFYFGTITDAIKSGVKKTFDVGKKAVKNVVKGAVNTRKWARNRVHDVKNLFPG